MSSDAEHLRGLVDRVKVLEQEILGSLANQVAQKGGPKHSADILLQVQKDEIAWFVSQVVELAMIHDATPNGTPRSQPSARNTLTLRRHKTLAQGILSEAFLSILAYFLFRNEHGQRYKAHTKLLRARFRVSSRGFSLQQFCEVLKRYSHMSCVFYDKSFN